MKKYYIRVKTREQLQAVCDWGKAQALLTEPGLLEEAAALTRDAHNKAAGLTGEEGRGMPDRGSLYVCLPDAARQNKATEIVKIIKQAEGRAGLVVKNPDELGMIKELGFEGPVICDSFLYAYNRESFDMYDAIWDGPEGQEIPYPAAPGGTKKAPESGMMYISGDELTDKELLQAVPEDRNRIIYKAYGYQPLMITNQCLRKNYGKCLRETNKTGGAADPQVPVLTIRNERGEIFYVQNNCSICYSVIYNGRKTCMLDRLGETDFENILLDFTIESGKETRQVLEDPDTVADNSRTTRGHHYKGVD